MKADAPRPLRIPRWVPRPVAAIARELSRTGMARSDRSLLVASEADFQRLLRAFTTDPRMKWIWRELGKRHGDGYLHPARQSRQPVADPQGRAMTVLFFHALKIICDVSLDQVSVASRKEVAEERERCANMARTLRAMAGAFLEPTPERPTPDEFDRGEARNYEAVAASLDRLAQNYVAGKQRDRGNALTRHVTGELVKACRIIFRSPMYRTVARIASVLLATNVSHSTVRTWYPRNLRE